jgi:hypothetical protein
MLGYRFSRRRWLTIRWRLRDDFYGKKRMRDPKMATEVTKRA